MSESVRYLCFNLGHEEFAIPLLSIKEVIGMPDVTPIPQSPAHFLGIMNLRGQVISILDLRQKLTIKPSNVGDPSVMILDLATYKLGVVVDQVNSVQMISSEDISEKPSIDTSKNHEYVSGVFRKAEKLILLIDIMKTLSLQDQTTLANQQVNKAA
jgi:purine-binding chemotaxis protein CheW